MTAVKTDEMKVKLTFDNRQFQQGVKESTQTLESFKKNLDLEQQATSFNGLTKAVNKVKFNGLDTGVKKAKALGKSFNEAQQQANLFAKTMTSFGTTLRKTINEKVVNKLVGTMKNIVTGIPKQIISGGKARAQNIEQAQFQLKGLLKDEYNWKQISEDLDFAVSGTRYGLDAAAKAAAQLRASNIGFGDEMKTALRGISGVASMTNSEYEDIAHIFTTIAGRGKLMTEQLNQFAGRGLNVAAELAKTYNVTEAELREMVTKGKVDFKTFAKAMNDAFGEQATKANDTFSGALSNVKASLSRMGAQFMTPGFEELRKVLVMLIPVFKDIEKLIKPVSARFEELAKIVSGFAVDTLRNIHFDLLESLGFKGTAFASQVNKVQEIYDGLHKNVEKSLTVEAKDAGDAAKEAVKTEEKSLDVYEAILEAYDGIQKSKEQQLKAGTDEATVLREEQISLDALWSILKDYDKELFGAAAGEKALTEETKKATDATSKNASVNMTARNKALSLAAVHTTDTKAVKENAAARKDATQAVVESTKAMAEAGQVAASNLFGLESGAFDTSVKKVTDYLADVSKESEKAFEFGALGDLVDPAKKLADETAIQQGLYVELEKAVAEINKTAEQQIKLGKDETVVNKEKEAALKRLRDIAESYDKQSIFSLDLLDKESKGRKATTQLYENAKKTVGGLKSGFLKLLGVEQEEGAQIQQNAGEYKGLEELALEVIAGKYDNGEERKKKLEELGYAYSIVQNKVNELLGCEKRHEVTAEDEAKMMGKLGEATGKAGEEVKKQKTNLEKVLDILAGVGAVLNIIKSAGFAVYKNILKPFAEYAWPIILGGILSVLSYIGEKLVQFNEWLTTSDFFETKTKALAEWFINLKNSVSEFWRKAKELEGVKKLGEAFEKFKTVVAEIGGKIFDKLKEGFKSVGEDTQSIFTMENMLNVLNAIAEKVASFLNFVSEHKDDIINALSGVLDFLRKAKDAIIEFFKDPIGSIKKFGTFIQNNLDEVRDKIRAFCDKLAKDPKATLKDFFGKLISTFGNIKTQIWDFFKSFIGGTKETASTAITKAFDLKDLAVSLFDKGKNLFTSFANGIKAFFSEGGVGGNVISIVKNFLGKVIENFDPKKAGLIAGVGGIGLIAAKIAKFILSLRNTFSLAKELPKKATELLSGLKGVLDGYAMNLKTDALLKVAGAIGIFALAITALSFIDQSKLLAVGGSLGAIMVGMAALIAAIGMYNKAKAMAKAAGIAESVKGVATAATTATTEAGEKAKGALTNPFAPIYQSISGFLDGMKEALSKAAKTVSMGVFLVMLAASIGILVLCVKALLKIDWQNEGIPAAIAVGVMLATLVASVAILNKLGGNGLKAGAGLALLGIVSSLYLLIGVIKLMTTFAKYDADGLNTGITYIALILAGFVAFSRLLKPDGLLKAAASLIVLSAALTLMVVPLIAMSLIPTDMMLAGIVHVIEVLGVLVIAAMAAGKAKGEGGGIGILLKLAGVLLLLAPAMILLGISGMIAWKGILALGVAIGLLVGAALILNKWGGDGLDKLSSGFDKMTKATLLLGPAIVILGLCLTAFGALFQKFWPQMLIGFAAFAVALTVIGAIATKFAVGFAAISLPLVALVGVILAFVLAAALLPEAAENIKNFFTGVTKVVGGIASGIGKIFGLFEEQEEKYETALDKYDKSINKLSYLSDEVKAELHNRFAELEHLDGSNYSIGIDNLVGYIYGLDLTPDQIQRLLTETMTRLQESAKEQFTIAFMTVEADIRRLKLSESEQDELLRKVKALASTVPGEFQTEIKELKTKIDEIIDDPTAAARIYALAVNAAKAEAVYKTVMDELEIYLDKCSLSEQAKKKIKTSISNITASDLNADYYIGLNDLKLQIEDNELGLDEFQQKKLSAMVDTAIKAGTTANLLVNSVLLAIEDENGVELSPDAKETIKTTIEQAAQLSLTNPDEAKTKIDNLVVELGDKYDWSPTAKKLLGGLIQNAFKAKTTLSTKLNALGIYTDKLGLTEKNDNGLTFAEQVSAAINQQQLPPIELENIWVEVKNANMTPEEVEELYTQVGNTINAAVDKELALTNLTLALDEVPGISEEDKEKILTKVAELENLTGTEREAKIEELVKLSYALADDTKDGRAGVQQFLNDLGIYALQAEDFRTVTIESMKVAINGVEWGDAEGQTKQDFIDRIEKMAHLSGAPLKAEVEDFIIALNNDPTIPQGVKTSLEEQARGLVTTYTSAYESELEAFYKRQAQFRKKKYLGSFITDEETGYTVKNGSEAAKGIKKYFEDQTEVTDQAIDDYMTYLEERFHDGSLTPEQFMAGIDGLDISDEEFINGLFPNGTSDVIDPVFFSKYLGPIIDAYVTGASAEFQHRLSRSEPGRYNFTQWLMEKAMTNKGGEEVVDYVALRQMSENIDQTLEQFLDGSESEIRDVLGKYDGEITLGDVLTALYGTGDEIARKDLQGNLQSDFERITHDAELLESLYEYLKELRQDTEFNEEEFFDSLEGTGEEIAKLSAQETNDAYTTYYNLEPAKKKVVDELQNLMHPGEEINPKDLYDELDSAFEEMGVYIRKLENGEWVQTDEVLTMEKVLGSDDPLHFLSEYVSLDMRQEVDKIIPGFSQLITDLLDGVYGNAETRNRVAEQTKEELSEGLTEGVEAGVKEAESNTATGGVSDSLNSLVDQLLTGGTEEGGVAQKAMEALKSGLESGDFDKDQLMSIITDKLTGGAGEGIDLSGLLGGVELDGLLPEDFSVASLVNKIFGGIEEGNLDLTKVQRVGGFLTEGLSSGMLSNLGSLTDAISGEGGIVSYVLGLLTGGFKVNSPSEETEKIGVYLDEGLAVGIEKGTSKIIRAMTHVVKLTLQVITNRITDFGTAGTSSGTAYATGLSGTSQLARIGAEMLALAAEWEIRSRISDAETVGEDWGKGFVKGLESQVDEARAAGRKLAAAPKEEIEHAGQIASPSKVAKRLGNFWGMGYVIGLNEYVKKAGRAGEDIGKATINALETPMRIIQDIIDSDVDASPVITPVLDLSNIQNGARRINGLLPVGAMDLGAISYSMANRHETTNADVVAAILGLSGSMESSRGDTYNINGVTYDDGSNIIDAVQTLVRAARVERRR